MGYESETEIIGGSIAFNFIETKYFLPRHDSDRCHDNNKQTKGS